HEALSQAERSLILVCQVVFVTRLGAWHWVGLLQEEDVPISHAQEGSFLDQISHFWRFHAALGDHDGTAQADLVVFPLEYPLGQDFELRAILHEGWVAPFCPSG